MSEAMVRCPRARATFMDEVFTLEMRWLRHQCACVGSSPGSPMAEDCCEAAPVPPAPAPSEAKRAVRHAEKPREASCPFADDVARVVLAKYRELAERVEGEMPRQTVVAGVVAVGPDGALECLSIGQGTKFVAPAALRAAHADGTLATLVRDSHAEILARRGLKRLVLQGHTLAEGTKLAFYSSTAMCGNSCLKKWAKNSNKKVDTLPHPTFHVSQREAGQVAVTVKGEHVEGIASSVAVPIAASANTTSPSDGTGESEEVAMGAAPAAKPPATDGLRVWPNGVAAPVGTTPAQHVRDVDCENLPHYTASCSDKLAQWCVLGLQGACGDAPVRLVPQWVVVGRKYGDATLRRALCCRLQTKFFSAVHHPLVYRTAIPLDESVYEDDEGASFGSPLCTWWVKGRAALECIDGTTGLTPQGTPSLLSRAALAALVAPADAGPADALAAYAARKAQATEYQALKATLLSHPKLLAPYPRAATPGAAGVRPAPQKRRREPPTCPAGGSAPKTPRTAE